LAKLTKLTANEPEKDLFSGGFAPFGRIVIALRKSSRKLRQVHPDRRNPIWVGGVAIDEVQTRPPDAGRVTARRTAAAAPVASAGKSRQADAMLASQTDMTVRRNGLAITIGIALSVLIGLPAAFAAIMSGGAGHGHYVAARALFPAAMLLTRFEGALGPLALTVALLQFPFYGALLGWSIPRHSFGAIALLAMIHIVLAIACFAGALPAFS
jgi:hypothetical protein